MGANGEEPRNISALEKDEGLGQIAWSPDGRIIYSLRENV
jgi:hypothetical protein